MHVRDLSRIVRAGALAIASVVVTACSGDGTPTVPAIAPLSKPPIRHVFTIILENQTYNNTFGATLPVPYLSKTAAAQGGLLQNYYGTSHFSLGNYVSLLSGQSVTLSNQNDCATYVNIAQSGTAAFDQVAGDGCIYPASAPTVADQLTGAGLTWKGYMEDMGADPTREPATCGQPIGGIGKPDNTQGAQVPPNFKAGGTTAVTDQYAARHNPFVYFHSLIDSGQCARNVVPLNQNTLPQDLQSIASTPNYVFITPNLCNDGHDVPCKTPGSPKSYLNENTFLSTWVPVITRSPAFQKDGLLIITFDETSLVGTSASGVNVGYDGTACCNEPSGPNTNVPGIPTLAKTFSIPITGGPGDSGGGQTGTLLLSPFIKGGTVSMTPYNHYYMLHEIEDVFSLPYLGYAGFPGTTGFGVDVFPDPNVRQQSVTL